MKSLLRSAWQQSELNWKSSRLLARRKGSGEFFPHKLVCDRSSMTHWCQCMGEEGWDALIPDSLAVAVKTKRRSLPSLQPWL